MTQTSIPAADRTIVREFRLFATAAQVSAMRESIGTVYLVGAARARLVEVRAGAGRGAHLAYRLV